jgi:diguanylate cyclase (GGDEF)-like protein
MAYQLRDRHGASRAVAYLMLAAAPFIFLTGIVLPTGFSLPMQIALALTSAVVGIGSWACWTRPHLMPDFFWLIAPILATTLITGLNLMTEDASTGSQLFYLWPVLYAANFLSRRWIYLTIIALLIGDGLVVTTVLGAKAAMADLAAMALAMTMTAVVVFTLRERGDQLLRRLEGQALADPLTGLANRRSFDGALETAGDWAQRTGRPLALVTVDLDYFKSINDTYGHAAGDLALQGVAGALEAVAEQDDVVARLGGDEFVMLLRADKRRALRVTEALRDLAAGLTDLPSGPPGLSIGVAVLPDDADSVEGLLKASDAALYDAKSRGRGQVATASSASAARMMRQNVDRTPHGDPALRA